MSIVSLKELNVIALNQGKTKNDNTKSGKDKINEELNDEQSQWINRKLGYPFDSFPNPEDTSNKNDKGHRKEIRKKVFVTYKYSNKGKVGLHEAIILNGTPRFITYNPKNNTVNVLDSIEESTRTLRPPGQEEYAYEPYNFDNEEQLKKFFRDAKTISSIGDLFQKSKQFFQKYVDQDSQIITMLAADSIMTYFQDLFPAIHYSEAIGTNDVGKSSIGYTFEYIGYRVIRGSSISGPNYYRILGTIEPGQCTIIEDEGDNISEDHDKVRILKSGYEYNAKIPKTNINTKDQEQRWFYTFCYKMILAEISLSQFKARGLVDRTFTHKCRPGKVEFSIKKVVSENIISIQSFKQSSKNCSTLGG